MMRPLLLLSCCCFLLKTSEAFEVARNRVVSLRLYGEQKDDREPPSPLLKAAWFATEAFGKVGAPKKQERKTTTGAPTTRADLVRRIAADNESDPPYFLAGGFDRDAYADDCEFSDPFVAFKGRDRFEDNLSNLGSSITEFAARPIGDPTIEEHSYSQKFIVKLRLALPWSPVLAWPWGVTHEFQETQDGSFLVVRHIEAWDVSPGEGLRQLFTPGANKKVV